MERKHNRRILNNILEKENGISMIVPVIALVLVITLIVTAIFIISKSNSFDNVKTENNATENNVYDDTVEKNISKSNTTRNNNQTKNEYNKDELNTEYNYYYITVDVENDKKLSQVKYVRYTLKDDEWVKAENENDSPFFLERGDGVLVNYSRRYYIPIYELVEGKNKIVVGEKATDGSIQKKEFIINRRASDYDEQYQIEEVEETDKITLKPYQKEIEINTNDYNGVLLTGSVYSNNEIEEITWTRYEHKNENDNEWKVLSKGEINRNYYEEKGKAKIFGNYWAIDILGLNYDETKIEITATDKEGNTDTKEVFIKSTSKPLESHDEDEENGDNEANVVVDKEGAFVANEVCIVFHKNVEEEECKDILKKLKGAKIKSEIGIVKQYLIKLDSKFESTKDIKEYCKKLIDSYEEIEDAYPNYVITASDEIEPAHETEETKLARERGNAKDVISLLINQKSQEYFEKKYNGNDNNDNLGTIKEYLENEFSEEKNISTEGYKVVIKNGKIEVSKNESKIVTGDITTSGGIAWED